ncbi:MAG: beta-eliminating lyase-related protein [Pseudomonadota bacterium]
MEDLKKRTTSEISPERKEVASPFFSSDNTSGIHPEIVEAMIRSNSGKATAYATDRYTSRLKQEYSELFEREVFVFAVPTGTAANGLALGAITPSHGTILCHEKAHIVTTECGAPEFYSGGARLTLLRGSHNKIDLENLNIALASIGHRSIHQLVPSAISLTQATECGVNYSLEEIQNLSDIAHSSGLKVHMDGARFANAMVSLELTPAEMSWKSGVDILSFGTTKNGSLNAEAVIVFDSELNREIAFKHKRAGLLCSKMRFMSAQLLAYIKGDLWLKNARAANCTAQRLRQALSMVPQVEFVHPTHINSIFAYLPNRLIDFLAQDGIKLRSWPGERDGLYRLIASFDDQEEQLNLFEASCIKARQGILGNMGRSGTLGGLI